MRRVISLAMFVFLGWALFTPAWGESFTSQQTEHFFLSFTAQDGEIAGNLIGEIEEIRKQIITDTGRDFPGKTVVLIAPTIESFQKLQPAGAKIPLWAAGVAYPESNLIILRSPFSVKIGHPDIMEIFTHELSHIAIGRTLDGKKIPVWLAEGLAMYESREWDFSRTAVLIRGALTNTLIPQTQLTSDFPSENDRAELAYAESFMFVSFLINRIGRIAFHRFIRDYSDHGDAEGALRRATGLSLPELQSKWLLYLKLRISWLPIATSATTLWFVATVIFIAGYIRKRKQGRATLRRWEEEDPDPELKEQ
jgi:hypothetical protein